MGQMIRCGLSGSDSSAVHLMLVVLLAAGTTLNALCLYACM
jgi:hypothetical protein